MARRRTPADQQQGATAYETGRAAGQVGGTVGGALLVRELLDGASSASAPVTPAAPTVVAVQRGTSAAAPTAPTWLSTAAPYLGAASAAAGGYGLLRGIQADDPGTAAIGGAGLGGGLAAAAPLFGMAPLGPIGILTAALLGAGGGGLLGALLGHTPPHRIQERRENALARTDPHYEQALAVLRAHRAQGKEPNYRGRVYSGAPEDFVGEISPGVWVNNRFARSQDVRDLTAKDIWLTPDFFRRFPDWAQKSEAEKIRIAQDALDRGAVTARKGGIYVDFARLDNPSNASPAGPPMRKVVTLLGRPRSLLVVRS